MSLWRLPFHR